MRIVVTGALGHIGSRLIRDLPAAFPAAEIVLLDNLATQRYCSLFDLPDAGRYRFFEADVMTADLVPLFSGAQAVVHLAALTDPAQSFADRSAVDQVNVAGTERVARACIHSGAALVFVSTTSVYGTERASVDEDCPDGDLRPESPYAESKLAAERLLRTLAKDAGLRHLTCRFGTIFGASPGMRFHTAVNRFCWQAAAGVPVRVWRTAMDQQRPYLDLGDAVAALLFLLHRGRFDAELFNVETLNTSVREVVNAISRHVPQVRVERVDSPAMNSLSYEVRGGRLRGLGFACTGSLDRGIGETIALLRGLSAAPQFKLGDCPA